MYYNLYIEIKYMDKPDLKQVKEGCYVDSENNLFVKYFPKDRFNVGGYSFQKALPARLTQGFEIAQLVGDLKEDNDEVITFTRLYNIKEAEITPHNAAIIGKALARLHQIGLTPDFASNVKVKTSSYSDLSEWAGFVIDHESESWVSERESIIKQLPLISQQNQKAILHRDFRKHNLLESDGKIILIDFDFTAIDYIAIELGAFITDLIIDDKLDEIKVLKVNYLSVAPELEIEINKSLEIYLRYLCASNFPWGNKSTTTDIRFNELKNNRGRSFDTVKKIFYEGDIASFI
jgi:hypothetical protein